MTCKGCQQTFERPRRVGYPQLYCSPTCKLEAHKRRHATVSVAGEVYHRVHAVARAQGMSVKQFVEAALGPALEGA